MRDFRGIFTGSALVIQDHEFLPDGQKIRRFFFRGIFRGIFTGSAPVIQDHEFQPGGPKNLKIFFSRDFFVGPVGPVDPGRCARTDLGRSARTDLGKTI